MEMLTPATNRWCYAEGRNGCEWVPTQQAPSAVVGRVVVRMFCDEVVTAVDDTCRGPIMLMRSSGFPYLPLGRGCRGDMSRVCWYNVAHLSNKCFSYWAWSLTGRLEC